MRTIAMAAIAVAFIVALAVVLFLGPTVEADHQDVLSSPSIVENVRTTLDGKNRITILWNAPGAVDHIPVTHFSVIREHGSMTEILSDGVRRTSISYTDESDKVPGTEYTYRVQAHNDNGDGPLSLVSDASKIVWPELPDPVSDLKAEWFTGDQRGVKLTWNAPSEPVTRFIVYTSRDMAAPLRKEIGTVRSSDESLSFTHNVNADGSNESGLSLQQEMVAFDLYYSVVAENIAGVGESATADVEIPERGDSLAAVAPEDVKAELIFDGILLSWVYPITDEYRPVQNYTIFRCQSPDSDCSDLDNFKIVKIESAGASSWVDTNISIGRSYYYYVKAHNGLNSYSSAPENASAIVSIEYTTIPVIVANASTDSQDFVNLSWWFSPDNAVPTHDFLIFRSVNGSEFERVAKVDKDDEWSWVDDEISEEYRVQNLHYKIGLDKVSDHRSSAVEITIPEIRVDEPNPPTSVRASLQDDVIKITWTRSVTSFAQPVEYYHVEWSSTPDDDTTWSTVGYQDHGPGNPKVYDLNRLQHNTSYVYRVQALNSAGGSEFVRSSPIRYMVPTATPVAAPKTYGNPVLPADRPVDKYDVGDSISITLSRATSSNSDPLATPLTYSFQGLPSWLTGDAASRSVTAPEADRVGTHTFNWWVTDNRGVTDYQPITIEISAKSYGKPVLPADKSYSYDVGDSISITLSRATSSNSDPLAASPTYSFDNLPLWLEGDVSRRRVTGSATDGRTHVFYWIATIFSDAGVRLDQVNQKITLVVRPAPEPEPEVSDETLWCRHYHKAYPSSSSLRGIIYSYASQHCSTVKPSENWKYASEGQHLSSHYHRDDVVDDHGGEAHPSHHKPE